MKKKRILLMILTAYGITFTGDCWGQGGTAPTISASGGKENKVIDISNSNITTITAEGGGAPDKGEEWEKDGEPTWDFNFGGLNATENGATLEVMTDQKGTADITVKKIQNWTKKCDPSVTATTSSPTSNSIKRVVQEPTGGVVVSETATHGGGYTRIVQVNGGGEPIKEGGVLEVQESITGDTERFHFYNSQNTLLVEKTDTYHDVPKWASQGGTVDGNGKFEDVIGWGPGQLGQLVVGHANVIAHANPPVTNATVVKITRKSTHVYIYRSNEDDSDYGEHSLGEKSFTWTYNLVYSVLTGEYTATYAGGAAGNGD